MKQIIKQVSPIITVLFLAFFSMSLSFTQSVDHAALVLKLKYNSAGITGFGGKLILKNLETNDFFESQSKPGLSPYVIIENVPFGKYCIEELQIISGPNILKIRGKEKFNELEIREPKIYYLGSFLTKKVRPMLELHFQISKLENEDEINIYKQLQKKSGNWQTYQIDFSQSLFKSENTRIDL